MLKFAFKNMLIKKVQVILVILSIVISCGVAVLAYNTSSQVSNGITSNAKYYSLIIGPSGSKTQLAMNTMYYTDEPLGTIPYELVTTLQADSRVRKVIPFAIADNYRGYSLIGSKSDIIADKTLASGRLFDNSATFEVVLGYEVARACNLKVGDTIYTSHSVGEEHHTPFTVVGILEESFSVSDDVIFTELKSIWEVHEEEEEGEEHDHEELHNMVCSIIVQTVNPTYATQMQNEYDGKIYTDGETNQYSLTAIEPMGIVRSVLNDVNQTKYIVYILCAIILLMNIMIIAIITLLNMYHSVEEIKLMRLIGISMKNINFLYMIQNSIIGFVSILLAFFLSRFALSFMQDYVRSMGAVLNIWKVYSLEIVILLGVFVVNLLPTMIATSVMSKKDSISS